MKYGITKETIKQLQQLKQYPSLTITLPTHRTSPDNEKDAIRLKNFVSEAQTRLEETFGKRESATLLEKLNEQVEAIDHQYNEDGLVICISEEYAETYRLPYRLPERVAIDDNFYTRDLVYALNRDKVYFLLKLDAEDTNLYLGRREHLYQVTDYGFPFAIDGGAPGANIGKDETQAYRDEMGKMLKEVSSVLTKLEQQYDLSLVVVGIERNLGYWNETVGSKHNVLLTIDGGYTKHSAHELGELLWPQIEKAFDEKRAEVFEAISVAKGNSQLVSGLDECWQASLDGRVDTLVVETDLSIPAEVSEDGRQLTVLASSKVEGERAFSDIIDEMIENVLAADGQVVFVDKDDLKEEQKSYPLVAITRY
ncbi:hypothetical protein [Suttonella ornithocola]|uniref:Uncharacterized protein n=1 Tax=Suttonella ornithocola TaxID=279832 RepID=A0A380MS71_9GAMM|nr:hypothetical protein [Suttonella ornithocola]SUO94561.1 Uncharacterised protein [Suttonella ornithocola]